MRKRKPVKRSAEPFKQRRKPSRSSVTWSVRMKIADAEKVEKAREEMSSAVGVSIGISSYCRNAIMLHPQFVDLKHGLRNLIELLRSPPDETAPSGDDITGELADRLDLLLGGATS